MQPDLSLAQLRTVSLHATVISRFREGTPQPPAGNGVFRDTAEVCYHTNDHSFDNITCQPCFPGNMEEKRWVSYLRVSTVISQGVDGLGIAAQRSAVASFIAGKGEMIAEFVETESGKKVNRPQLCEALALCRKKKATLVIAKLDRLARNVHFISGLMESRVDFLAVDLPQAEKFTIHLLAAFAEEEARRISERTKAALKAAKARGVILGASCKVLARRQHEDALARAEALRSTVEEIKSRGLTRVRDIQDELNRLGIPSPRGGQWHVPTTHRMLVRLRKNEKK